MANQHPVKQHPKKKMVSPSVPPGAITSVRAFWAFYKSQEPETQAQMDSDSANLIKEIQRG